MASLDLPQRGAKEATMYVCLCNGYRDAELREWAGKGLDCAIAIYHALGNGPCCGRCLECAQQIVDETLSPGTTVAQFAASPAA